MPFGQCGHHFSTTVRLVCAAGFLSALAPACLSADESASAGVTLSDAVQLALSKNWDQLSAERDVGIAIAQRETAHEFANPTLAAQSTDIGRHARDNVTVQGSGLWARSYDTVVEVTQPFEAGGKRRIRQEAAAAGLEAARAQLGDARRTRTLDVTRAYVAAVVADLSADLVADSAEHLRKEAQIAGVRLKAGEIAVSELDQLQITADQLELQAERARADAHSQRIALEVLLGYPRPNGEIHLLDTAESLALAASDSSLETDTHFVRPDIAAAEQLVRKADADWRMQRAMRVPDPSLLLEYEHQPPDQGLTFGLGVSFPLPVWNRNSGAIRAAGLTREQANLMLLKIQSEATADVANARADRQVAFNQWERYRQHLRPAAERVLETVSIAYQHGGASLLDLLEAQRSTNDIRLSWAQAAGDLTIARAEWQAATSGASSKN